MSLCVLGKLRGCGESGNLGVLVGGGKGRGRAHLMGTFAWDESRKVFLLFFHVTLNISLLPSGP